MGFGVRKVGSPRAPRWTVRGLHGKSYQGGPVVKDVTPQQGLQRDNGRQLV